MKPPNLRDALKVRWLKLFPFTSPILWLFFALGFFSFCGVIAVMIAQHYGK